MIQELIEELRLWAQMRGVTFKYCFDEDYDCWMFNFSDHSGLWEYPVWISADQVCTFNGPVKLLAKPIIDEFERRYNYARI